MWGDPAARLIQGYTDHGIPHSRRVAGYACHLLAQNGGPPFSPQEIYLLLAGTYLHDIGMQCDVVKWPRIRKLAEKQGARFDLSFTASDINSYTHEEQKAIRSQHHHLAAAWIEFARSGQTVLGPAAQSIPPDLVGDLMEVCRYHAHLSIEDCPASGKVHRKFRVQLVAAVLRLADELDIAAARVEMATVKNFNLPPPQRPLLVAASPPHHRY